jgi:hypothetical protein
MGENTNHLGTTTADDYLKDSQSLLADLTAGNTASERPTPEGVLLVDEATCTVSDSATAATAGATGAFVVTEGADMLKLWLQFNNAVTDASENSNGGTVTGTTTYIAAHNSILNGAFSLNGSSLITVANESQFDFERTAPFSVAFWVKYSSQNNKVIIGKATGSIGATGWQIWLATGLLNVSLTNTDATNQVRVTCSDTAIDDDLWHHVVVTYSGSSTAAGVKVYFDSVSQSLTTVTNNLNATILNNTAVVIGALPGGTNYYTGGIDDVRIYNIELSAAQAGYLFTNYRSIYDPPGVVSFSDTAA